jgi:hypothetical protein
MSAEHWKMRVQVYTGIAIKIKHAVDCGVLGIMMMLTLR